MTILLAFGSIATGCSDNSKPGLAQVKELVAERFGQCPQWSISDIQRIDGAPNTDGYEVSYSFVLECPRRPKIEPPGRLNFEPGWRPV